MLSINTNFSMKCIHQYFRPPKIALYCRYPARNAVHVACMFHAIIIDLHALHDMHVMVLMYMHVSCNMHGFGMFSMHIT